MYIKHYISFIIYYTLNMIYYVLYIECYILLHIIYARPQFEWWCLPRESYLTQQIILICNIIMLTIHWLNITRIFYSFKRIKLRRKNKLVTRNTIQGIDNHTIFLFRSSAWSEPPFLQMNCPVNCPVSYLQQSRYRAICVPNWILQQCAILL